MVACDTPQKLALRDLAKSGIEASGRSLVAAITTQDVQSAALLLEAGVYTEQRDSKGRTPLAIAVENRDFSQVFMLLNARANVNVTLANKASLLGVAAEQRDSQMIDTLLVAGARTDGLMPDGEKILPWAIREGRLDLVRTMMLAEPDPHLKDRLGNPLLHVAMEAGRRDLMEVLIDLGADPGTTNPAGETTIHLALRQGWIDAVPKLAAAGADPNAPGPDGRTLLEQAVTDGDLKKMALFLKIGADPYLSRNPESTGSPLERVFESRSPEMFEMFLQQGVKPPQGNWDTWLWQAFRHRDLLKTRILLSNGARFPRPNPKRLSLLETAVLAGNGDFVKLLLDYGSPVGRAVYLASAKGDHKMVELVLGCGASPNFTRFPTQDTALCAAIRGRHDRVAQLLVEYGADTGLKPPEGQTAFLLAVATGCHRTVSQMLDSGADPNATFSLPVSPAFLRQVRPGAMRWVLKMDRNATPLMVAADSGSIPTARYLMRAGAKTGVRTRMSSLWPINFASSRGDVAMMRLFLGQDPHREERCIEVRLSEQRAQVMDAEGNVIFTTKVSTGKKGFSTPTGVYVITNKHRDWTSTLYHASMPYFQRLSCGDFGMHQGNVPGYPASHGCIRVPAGNAAKLFGMTKTGDRVRIVP